MRARRAAAVTLAAALLGGCAAMSSSTAAGGTSAQSVVSVGSTKTTASRRAKAPTRNRRAQLPVSTAGSTVVQRQPPAGSCHARGSGAFTLTDPRCTPGAISPAVTQSNLHSTICRSGYTKTVRPPESVTDREKLASMAAYGDSGSPHAYEYDHLISLELGGASNDPRNLWPQPGGSPNTKDSLEHRLHALVCDGQISLATAQRQIASNWAAAYHHLFG